MAIRVIRTIANVILTFEETEQMIYNADLSLMLPETPDAHQAFEIDVVRQLIEPVVAEQGLSALDNLVKISVCYSTTGTERGETIEIGDDALGNAAMDFLTRNNAKYYFQPNQRDDYENRLVESLGIGTKTADFEN